MRSAVVECFQAPPDLAGRLKADVVPTTAPRLALLSAAGVVYRGLVLGLGPLRHMHDGDLFQRLKELRNET